MSTGDVLGKAVGDLTHTLTYIYIVWYIEV